MLLNLQQSTDTSDLFEVEIRRNNFNAFIRAEDRTGAASKTVQHRCRKCGVFMEDAHRPAEQVMLTVWRLDPGGQVVIQFEWQRRALRPSIGRCGTRLRWAASMLTRPRHSEIPNDGRLDAAKSDD